MTHTIDATNQSLGRLASRIAILLRGKDKPSFEAYRIPNETVVVSNVDKIKYTGSKLDTKSYYHYSGYPGGMKSRGMRELVDKRPERVLWMAVYRMLPPNRQRNMVIKNLKFK